MLFEVLKSRVHFLEEADDDDDSSDDIVIIMTPGGFLRACFWVNILYIDVYVSLLAHLLSLSVCVLNLFFSCEQQNKKINK